MNDELDLLVRQAVYDGFITAGRALPVGEIARRLDTPEPSVRASIRRLADAHMLVLQPSSGEVLMANPFSAVPTAFAVSSQGRSWWGNCIWDGLGILAMLAVGRGRCDCMPGLRRGNDSVRPEREDLRRPKSGAFRRSRQVVVGRRPLHLTHDAALPVGRAHRSLDSHLAATARGDAQSGAALGAGACVVCVGSA